jgi:hypothetical protein
MIVVAEKTRSRRSPRLTWRDAACGHGWALQDRGQDGRTSLSHALSASAAAKSSPLNKSEAPWTRAHA